MPHICSIYAYQAGARASQVPQKAQKTFKMNSMQVSILQIKSKVWATLKNASVATPNAKSKNLRRSNEKKHCIF